MRHPSPEMCELFSDLVEDAYDGGVEVYPSRRPAKRSLAF